MRLRLYETEIRTIEEQLERRIRVTQVYDDRPDEVGEMKLKDAVLTGQIESIVLDKRIPF